MSCNIIPPPPLSHLPHIAASLPIDKSSTGSACSLFSPHKLCKSSANLVWPCLSLDSILVLAKTITEQEWSALWEDQIAWPPGFNNTGLRSVVKVKGEFISHYNNLQFLSHYMSFCIHLIFSFSQPADFPDHMRSIKNPERSRNVKIVENDSLWKVHTNDRAAHTVALHTRLLDLRLMSCPIYRETHPFNPNWFPSSKQLQRGTATTFTV